MSEFYDRDELITLGFRTVGDNCHISKKVSFYAIDGFIGNHVRIDDFCVLKGKIEIGSYVHIASFSLVTGVGGLVRFKDCSALSSGVHIYTASDNYSAPTLSNPTVPREMTQTISGDVEIGVGVVIGAHSVILPSTKIHDGASVGALSIVIGEISHGDVMISPGTRAVKVKERDTATIINLANKLLGSTN